MRMNCIVAALGLGALISGCTLVDSTTRNLAFETVLGVDRKVTCIRNRTVANSAWKEIQQAYPEQHFSADYVRGFKHGYAEFLRTGAPAGPPPIPPRWYWKVCYQSPAGHQAMEDWMAGFTQGVAAARATGDRGLVAVPTSVPPPTDMDPLRQADRNAPATETMTPLELFPPRKEISPAPEGKILKPTEWKPNASPFSPLP